MRDHIHRTQAAREGGKILNGTGGQVERVKVPAKRPFNPGAQHLNGHLNVGRHHSGMVHLRNRRGRDRVRELGKQRLNRRTQFRRHHGAGLFHRERRQLVLQVLQLLSQILADNIRPGRQDLSELDVGRAQRRQRPGDGWQGRIPPQSQPLERPAQKPGRKAQAGRRLKRLKHHIHRPAALKRGTGADQPPDIVRTPHQIFQPE